MIPPSARKSARPIPSLVALSFCLAVAMLCSCSATSLLPSGLTGSSGPEVKPVDFRSEMPADQFRKSADGEWLSKEIAAEFPFDELIYSWKAKLSEQQGFRLYLKVGFDKSQESPWLYAGFWGARKNPVEGRQEPTFDRGAIAMDQLLLKTKAKTWQFKVVDDGTKPLEVLPSLTVVITDNKPAPELSKRYSETYPDVNKNTLLLDIPLRRQVDSKGAPTLGRCQSAALASALEYYGKPLPLEDIIAWTHDPEYDFPGIWPRTIGAAAQFDFDAYIDRFRDWDRVRATLAQNKVILCSIKMPEGEYIAPPYPNIGGHIVALNGLTDDGRVVVTDSALGKSAKGYRCQWVRQDFEKVWWKTKGGVGMVICPPPGATQHLVTDLPVFPTDRTGGKPLDFEKEL